VEQFYNLLRKVGTIGFVVLFTSAAVLLSVVIMAIHSLLVEGVIDYETILTYGISTPFIIALFLSYIARHLINTLQEDNQRIEALKEDLEYRHALLDLTLEGTRDAIVVTNMDGDIITFNKNFRTLWDIPKSLLQQSVKRRIAMHLLKRIKRRRRFIKLLQTLYKDPLQVCNDKIELLNYKVLAFYSFPQRKNGKLIGRIWAFSDVSEVFYEKKRLEFFRFVMDQTGDGIFLVDSNHGTIIEANQKALEWTGYHKHEFDQLRFHHLIAHDDLEGDFKAFKQVFITHKKRCVNARLLHREGASRSVEFHTAYAEYDHKDYLVIVVRDITAREQAEQAMHASERKFREMFEGHSAVMLLIDPSSSRIVDANSAASRYYGYSKSELLHLKITEINTMSKEEVEEEEQHARKRDVNYFHFKHRLKDGRIRDVEVYSTPLTVNERLLLFSIVHDITERKRAEAEMVRHRNELYAMIENAPMVIYMCDMQGRYLRANRHLEKLLKRPQSQIVGQTHATLYEPSVVEVLEPNDRKVYEQKETLSFKETMLVKGKVHSYFSVKFPMRTPEGEMYALCGMALDITELETYKNNLESRVEKEIKARREHEKMMIQQSKMAALGEMLGAIAHQWRQPLNAAALFIQGLEDAYAYEELDAGLLRDSVKGAMDQIEYLSQTIDDFRHFFKPDAQKELFDVSHIIHELLKLLGEQYRKEGVVLRIEGGGFNLYGYPNEFKQVIMNLLNNAKDAIMGLESLKGEVVITLSSQGNQGVVCVCDNGGGIPESIIERIFEPYFTTKDQLRGTGIGLYMVRSIVERNMGGRIQAFNHEKGACFNLSFTLQDALSFDEAKR